MPAKHPFYVRHVAFGDAFARDRRDRRAARRAALWLAALAALDCAAAVALWLSVHGWRRPPWRTLLASFGSSRDAGDFVVLAFARPLLFALAGLALLAWARPAGEGSGGVVGRRRGAERAPKRRRKPSAKKRVAGDDAAAPLLPVVQDEDMTVEDLLRAQTGSDGSKEGEGGNGGLKGGAAAQVEEVFERQLQAHIEGQGTAWRATAAELCFFLVSAVFQLYISLKVVAFHFANAQELKLEQGLLMALAAPMVMLEAKMAADALKRLTERLGVKNERVHHHALVYLEQGIGHDCDVCRLSVHTKQCLVCYGCDFDCCLGCWRRAERRRETDEAVGGSASTSSIAGSAGANGMLGSQSGPAPSRVSVAAPTVVMGQRELFKHLGRLVAPEALTFSMAFLSLTGYAALALFMPSFQGSLVDAVIHDNHKHYMSYLIKFASVSVGSCLFRTLNTFAFNYVGRRVEKLARTTLYKAIINRDIAFFDAHTSGDLTSRLNHDVEGMVRPLQTAVPMILQNGLLFMGAMAMCFVTSWRLSMLAFTTLLPVTWILAEYSEWSTAINREIYAKLGEANAAAQDTLGNIRTVRAFSTENEEIQRYNGISQEALDKGVRDAWYGSGQTGLSGLMDVGASVLMLAFGGKAAMDPTSGFTIGSLITFQLYWTTLQMAFKTLQGLASSFTKAAGASQRILGLLVEPEVDPDAGEQVSKAAPFALSLQEVRFHYALRPDLEVLRGLNLEVPGGTTAALVGRSGGGKSTVVHMLLRYYTPTAGRILVDGRDLRSLNLHSYHRAIGLVSQDTQIFAKSVLYNIRYGSSQATMEEVRAAAKLASADEFIMNFPDGYDTRVGERGVRLSGGQKQRLAIARMLLRHPRLLLLDEATSALDAESEAMVQSTIDRLVAEGQRTVILVAHRLSTVINANRIAVVDKGRIVESGPHEQLLAQQGIYARLVSRQLAKRANLIEDAEGDQTNKAAAADSVDALLAASDDDETS